MYDLKIYITDSHMESWNMEENVEDTKQHNKSDKHFQLSNFHDKYMNKSQNVECRMYDLKIYITDSHMELWKMEENVEIYFFVGLP